MTTVFISHSSQDDAFVRALRAALADHGQTGWIDSRELRGGDPLWPEIQKAIEGAAAYAVVVSPEALQSAWVGKELRHALMVQKRRSSPNLLRRLYQSFFPVLLPPIKRMAVLRGSKAYSVLYGSPACCVRSSFMFVNFDPLTVSE